MNYAIALLAAGVIGFMLPPRRKEIIGAIILGAVLLGVAAVVAIIWSFDTTALRALFLLGPWEEIPRPALVQLVGVGYAIVLGALISSLRMLFGERSDATG